MKRRIYEILTNTRPHDRVGRIVSFALMTLIALNVVACIIETDAAIRTRLGPVLDGFEIFSLVVFTIEYILRIWSCTADPRFAGTVSGRVRMMLTPMALIDLVAIGVSIMRT